MPASTHTEATLFDRMPSAPNVSALPGYRYILWPSLLALVFLLARFWEGFGLVAIALFLFVPGFALVRALELQLDSMETAFISVLAGGAVLLAITNVIAMSPIDLSGEAILGGEVIVLLIFLRFGSLRSTIMPSTSLTDWALGLSIAFAPLLLLRAVFQHDFFMGYDPFTAAFFSDSIATHSISPFSFRTHDVNYIGHEASGFYYFTAGLSLATDITVTDITKYGGLVLLGLSSGLLFLTVKAGFQRPLAGLMAAALFMSNPFVLDRFVMYIRENLGIVLFLGLLLLLVRAPRPLPVKTMLLATLLTGVIIQVQPVVGLLSIITWCALFLWLRFQPSSRWEWLRLAMLAAAAIALFTLPSGAFIVWEYSTDFIPAQIRSIAGTLPAENEIFYIWDRGIFWEDFSPYVLALAPLGLVFIGLQRAFTRATLLIASGIVPVLGMFILAWLGASVPVVRTIVYLALGASILGGVGIALLFSASSQVVLRGGLLAAAAYLVFLSAQGLYDFEKWSPFDGDQMAAARLVAERSESENAVVLTPFNELGLLGLARVPGVVTDRDILIRTLTTPSLDKLADELNTLGADDRVVLFFISKEFARDGVRLVPSALGGSPDPFTFLTHLRQNSPADVSLGGPPNPTASILFAFSPFLHVVESDLGAAYLYEITTVEAVR